MDWLATLFLAAFLFGLVFSVGSLLLGVGHLGIGHDGLHFGGHDGFHLGGSGQGAGGSHAVAGSHGATDVSPLNITGLTAFIAWFGGIGYLALTGWALAAWLSLAIAVAAGVLGWGIIYLFFTKVLLRGETAGDPVDAQLEGTVARVTMPIGADRIGEIQYTRAGSRRSDGARSVDGCAIPREAEVVIVRYEGGIAVVEPWQSFVGEEAPQGR